MKELNWDALTELDKALDNVETLIEKTGINYRKVSPMLYELYAAVENEMERIANENKQDAYQVGYDDAYHNRPYNNSADMDQAKYEAGYYDGLADVKAAY